MVQLTISCGCGRKMTPNTLLGAGHFRCGCGMRIRIEGLPVRPARQCPVVVLGRLCNQPKEPGADTCDQCAERITRTTMTRPDIWRRVALADVKARYDIQRQYAIEEYTKEREQELERQRELSTLTDYNVVYYVQVRPGVVKIGTTRHLPTRMTALRVTREDVLAAEPGTRLLEKVRHKQFAHLQTGRYPEDFTLADDLRAHIDSVVAKHGAPYALSDAMVARKWRELDRRRTQS